MIYLDALVRTEWAKAVGWTLVHSLWEGAAIALALAIVLGIARTSRVRYAAACFAMLGILIGFGVTFSVLAPREVSRPAAVGKLPRPASPTVDNRPAAANSPWDVSEVPPWLAPIWLAGVLLFQLRCLLSWVAAGRLRRAGVCCVSSEWIERLEALRTRLRLTRPVTLLESCFAEVPVVIGHLRPVILMPVGLLAGLPSGQVEAILLHELAHIRRADYLVNLLQTLVEGLLFYHPAVWWTSRAIRNERENCCDDLVVLTSGDAHEYATALAALETNRWTMRQTALAANGGDLVKRIRRLLAQPEGPRTAFAPVLSMGILVVTGAVAFAAWQPAAPAPLIKPLPLLIAQAQTAPAPATSKYDRWVKEEVVYIITDRERAEFKKLETDGERDRFINEFWKRRDPTPDTPRNEFKDEHYRRITLANNRFTTPSGLPGWKTDRGRIYIEYGPPDEIDSHPAGGAYTRPPEEGGAQAVTYPFELWRYRWIEGIGTNVIIEFVDKAKTGDFRMTMDPSEKVVAQASDKEKRLADWQKMAEEVRAQHEKMEPALAELAAAQRRLMVQQAEVERLHLQSMAEKAGPLIPVADPAYQQRSEKLAEAERDVQAAMAKLSLLRQKYTNDWPEVRLTRAQLAIATQARDELLYHDQTAKSIDSRAIPEQGGRQQSNVFVSESSPQTVVAILPDRVILAKIPFEFYTEHYLVNVSVLSSEGKMVWSNRVRETYNSGSLPMIVPALMPDSYKLTATVKDEANSTEKTYVVHFSVN